MKRLRLLVVVVVTLAALVVAASPAAAHAELQSTTPAGSARVDEPPPAVVLRFTEPVEASLGAVRVWNADADRVDSGRVVRAGGDERAISAPLPELPRGVYVVTWRVVSVDGHPIQGAFTFRVGTDEDDSGAAALAREMLEETGGDDTTGALFAVARFTVFVGLLGLVGGAVFLVFVWPPARARCGARRVVWAAWAAATAGTVAAIALQGAYGGGLGVSDAADPAVIRASLDTRYGTVSAARLVVLLAAAALLLPRPRAERPGPSLLLRGGLAVVAVALAATPGLAGHAAAGELVAVAIVMDTVHVLAVSVWLGGLAVLGAVLFRNCDIGEVRLVVPRFSRIATWCVAVTIATGTFQSWRQVRVLDAATATTYGRLLLVKIGLFALLLGAAAVSRRWVAAGAARRRPAVSPGPGAMAAPDGDRPLSVLRRSVLVELGVAAVILAVTALLVNAPPARTALAQPYSAELRAEGLLVDVTVDPARAGTTDVHVYTLTPEGAVRDVEDVRLELRLRSEGIGPLVVPTRRAGPGHFAAYGFDLPLAGTWELEAIVRITDVDEVRATTTVPVR